MAKQTFIGAYARQRRVGRPPQTQSPVPEPPVPVRPLPNETQPNETQPNETLPTAEKHAEDRPLPSVQDSISVADTSQVWLGELDGKMLRIDTPVPTAIAETVATPASQPNVASSPPQPIQPHPNQTPETLAHASAATVPAPIGPPAPVDQPTPVGKPSGISEPAPVPMPAPVEESASVTTPVYPESEPVHPESATGATDVAPSVSANDVNMTPSIETVDVQETPLATTEPSRWTGAAWEVDAFDVPQSVSTLFFDEVFFRSIANQMRESVDAGLRTMMITSATRGAGRSTVAIGTAIAAAATGIRVLLVDTDLDNPRLLEHLRLDSEADWVSVLRQNESLEAAAIYSIEDSLTLLPLAMLEDRTLPVSPNETERLLQIVDGMFDLIIFDAPQVNSWITQQMATIVDSGLIVRDTRSTSHSEVGEIAEFLRGQGLTGLGVVDNFCN
ncbi:MAG: cellulose synthase operon protein YhjQ/BcsQ [Planctomycetota bacterium]